MKQAPMETQLEQVVAVARSARPDYGELREPVPAPELPAGEARTVAQSAVRDLLRIWGLDARHAWGRGWNTLGEFVRPHSRVLLKPNWVVHENASGAGMDCLVTHASVIASVLEYVSLARPESVVLGDAPIQRCDFDRLRSVCGLDAMVDGFRRRGLRIAISDFRRTALEDDARRENMRPAEQYSLFDLGQESLLEPAPDQSKFRVTMYNPDLLGRTHARGRHQYLVAREAMDADVVINLPKLKCHKKACVTGALKNLIGINGNKEYLPHHRKGGAGAGGDCYPGRWRLKEAAEALLDRGNRGSGAASRGLMRLAALCVRGAEAFGADGNLEGSWFGNDTVWRTCLDLQRILRYGKTDGSMAESPQRTVVSITDAIVGGEGEGPLAPTPVNSGFVTGAFNPAAAEWVHALLMGFDPRKIPLIREAFGAFRFPLTSFGPAGIAVVDADGPRPDAEIYAAAGPPFLPPRGWKGHCERDERDDRTTRKPPLVA
jgi:uncharacterized protein (DUF362 family)